MKKYLSLFASAAMALGLLSSCGGSAPEILKCVPADAPFVAVGQTKAIFQNAGIECDDNQHISFPKYITSNFPEVSDNTREINKRLEEIGIDISQAALFVDKEIEQSPVIVFKIADADKFDKFFTKEYDNAITVKDGVRVYSEVRTYYRNREECMVQVGDYAYFVPSTRYDSEKPSDVVLDIIKRVEKENFASTKIAPKMGEANVGAIAINVREFYRSLGSDFRDLAQMVPVSEGYTLITANIDGKEMVVESAMLNEDGDVLDQVKMPEANLRDYQLQAIYNLMAEICNNMGPVDAKTLRYLNSDTNLAFGINLASIDFAEVIDNLEKGRMLDREAASMARIASMYLSNIDGTIAMGVGYNGNLTTVLTARESEQLKQVSLSFAVEMKEGTASRLIKDVTPLLSQSGLTYNTTEHGFSIMVPDADMTVYVSAVDNLLVMSNKPFAGAKDNAISSCGDVDGSLGCVVFSAPKSTPLFSEAGIKFGIEAYAVANANKAQGKMVARVTDTDENFVPALVNGVLNLANAAQRIQSAHRYNYDNYDNYDGYYDDYLEEEAAVVVDSLYYE